MLEVNLENISTKNEVYKILYINNKPESSEVIIFNKPSPEQIEFANSVLEILSPTLNSFGFVRIKLKF